VVHAVASGLLALVVRVQRVHLSYVRVRVEPNRHRLNSVLLIIISVLLLAFLFCLVIQGSLGIDNVHWILLERRNESVCPLNYSQRLVKLILKVLVIYIPIITIQNSLRLKNLRLSNLVLNQLSD